MKVLIQSIFLMILIMSCSSDKNDAVSYATYNYTEDKEPPLSVDVLEVTESTLVPGIRASGIIEGINEITVISETQGIIQKLEYEIGSFLKRGDLLLSVDSRIAGINKDQAKLELDSAFIDFQSVKKFYDSGSTSQAEYIKAESVYNTRKAQYERALKTFKDCTIRSPIDGYVATKASGISRGAYISQGTPIGRIIDTTSFKLKISVGERQVGLLKKDQKANVMIPAVNEIKMAKVAAVAGGSNRDTGSFQVIIAWKNEKKSDLKSGMSASVEIDTSERESGIIIPAVALTSRDSKEYVFVAKNNHAEALEVTIGDRMGDRILIKSGLKIKDSIIITRVQTLKPGQNIITRNQGKSGEWR